MSERAPRAAGCSLPPSTRLYLKRLSRCPGPCITLRQAALRRHRAVRPPSCAEQTRRAARTGPLCVARQPWLPQAGERPSPPTSAGRRAAGAVRGAQPAGAAAPPGLALLHQPRRVSRRRPPRRSATCVPGLAFFLGGRCAEVPAAGPCVRWARSRGALARALYELRDFQGAVDAFQGALGIDPHDAVARCPAACVFNTEKNSQRTHGTLHGQLGQCCSEIFFGLFGPKIPKIQT